MRGHRNPRASSIHGPMTNDYDSGYHAGVMKREKGVAEDQISELSVGPKIRAYAGRSEYASDADHYGDDEETEKHSDKADKIMANIRRKHGDKAAQHADRAATSRIAGRYHMPSMKEGWGMGGYATAIGSEIQPGKGVDKEMPEGDEYNEYDDEVDMVENNLHTIIRACKDLADVLIAGENMPEWVEEKISMAKQNMVTVAEYIQSQHEQGHVYKEAGHPDEKEDKELIRKMVKRAALKQETNDPYMAELHARLAEKIPKNAPVKAYIDDFAKAAKTPNAKGHHQFKNKSPEKVRQMAIAASYGAKNPSKKKK